MLHVRGKTTATGNEQTNDFDRFLENGKKTEGTFLAPPGGGYSRGDSCSPLQAPRRR